MSQFLRKGGETKEDQNPLHLTLKRRRGSSDLAGRNIKKKIRGRKMPRKKEEVEKRKT